MTVLDFRHPSRREHFVYRTYDAAGQLLYVGCTMNLRRRTSEHRSNSHWFSEVAHTRLVGPLTYAVARQIERQAIRTEHPLHNYDEPSATAARRKYTAIFNPEFQRLMTVGLPWWEATHMAATLAAAQTTEATA